MRILVNLLVMLYKIYFSAFDATLTFEIVLILIIQDQSLSCRLDSIG